MTVTWIEIFVPRANIANKSTDRSESSFLTLLALSAINFKLDLCCAPAGSSSSSSKSWLVGFPMVASYLFLCGTIDPTVDWGFRERPPNDLLKYSLGFNSKICEAEDCLFLKFEDEARTRGVFFLIFEDFWGFPRNSSEFLGISSKKVQNPSNFKDFRGWWLYISQVRG